MSEATLGDPSAPRPAREVSEGLHFLGRLSDFVDGEVKVFVIDGVEVGVYRRGDEVRAYENLCPHAGGPVCEGLVLGKVEPVFDEVGRIVEERFSEDEVHIVCPWHGFEFDIDDGHCVSDRRMRLRRYEVALDDGNVHVVA